MVVAARVPNQSAEEEALLRVRLVRVAEKPPASKAVAEARLRDRAPVQGE